MNPAKPPRGTAPVEVSRLTAQGLWLRLDAREHFLAFERFPAFRDAPIRALATIEYPCPTRLYWPELDLDLPVQSIAHPGPPA